MHHAVVVCPFRRVPIIPSESCISIYNLLNELPASRGGQTPLNLWIYRGAGEVCLSSVLLVLIDETKSMARTRQNDSFALELAASTPRSLSLRLSRLLILVNGSCQKAIRKQYDSNMILGCLCLIYRDLPIRVKPSTSSNKENPRTLELR